MQSLPTGEPGGKVLDSVEISGEYGTVREILEFTGKGYSFSEVWISGPYDGAEWINGFLYSPERAAVEWYEMTGRIVLLGDDVETHFACLERMVDMEGS